MDSSRKLISICAISFVISLCLTLHACVQTFDVIGVKKNKGNQTPPKPLQYIVKFLEYIKLVCSDR
jgi:hypothetical protein